MTQPILPGNTIGVLGSGQLGRMLAIAARRLGYRVHVFSPDDDTPTGQVADVEVAGAYDDLDAVAKFAADVQVVTFEFENVPSATTDIVERYCPVRPAGQVLHTTQHRLREKSFFKQRGLPVTPFAPIATLDELKKQLGELGTPAVLKTAAWGYDGKGQVVIRDIADAEKAWAKLNTPDAILEAFIEFDCEVSVVVARDIEGRTETYGPMLNRHANHILDISICPAPIPPAIARRAIEIAIEAAQSLEVVGVLCVEFFLTSQGELMINECAPRPHNSGHLTIDAHASCQFEQQVRAVCGLKLGSSRQLAPAAMANLLGDVWSGGEPNWAAALGMPDVKLHLYGKREARPGRKMGHLTARAATTEAAAEMVEQARNLLQRRS